MKLRNRLGYLNVLPEERPPKKLSSSLTVVIYFSLLSAIFIYLLFYTLSGFFYVTARGHVELSKYFVQTDRNGKIVRFLVRPDEKVVQGQPLFEIRKQAEKRNSSISGNIRGRTNRSLQEQMLSLEQVLANLAKKDGAPSYRGGISGEASGGRELSRLINDIRYTRSRIKDLAREIAAKTSERGVLVDELSNTRTLELSKFGKSVIPILSGIAKDTGKLDREIVRRENALKSFRDSLEAWKAFRQDLGGKDEREQGILVSREIVRLNNEIRSRGAALSLLKRQLDDKTKSRHRLKTSFTEVRILELAKEEKRSSGGITALDNEINDFGYKIADIENRLDSLVSYREDLVDNEIKSLEYKVREEIRKIVELRRNRLDGHIQYKVIAREQRFVLLDKKIKELVSRKSRLETKLNSLIKSGTSLAENEIEKLRYEISQEQYENGQMQGHSDGNGGYFFRPGAGYGNFVSSPVEGSVMLLYRREGEYAKKGDIILSIREKGAEVKVKGFFKTRNMSSIHPEKEVVIKFPDNTRSPGIIKKFYSSLLRNTGDTPSPAVDPPEIVVDIVPRDPSEAVLWERYDQIEVSIEAEK